MSIKITPNNKDYTVPKVRGPCGGTRFNVAILGLAVAVVNCYAQATFCIAIVEMVLPADHLLKSRVPSSLTITNTKETSQSSSQLEPSSVDNLQNSEDFCPFEYKYRDFYDNWEGPILNGTTLVQPHRSQASKPLNDRFDWDSASQGVLLGAFAIGTAPLQILGGRLAEIYGAKWVLLVSCLGTGLTSLTIPFFARLSFSLLLVNRVLMGVAQAGMEPGLMCLLSGWLAPSETGFFISMSLFAICMGFFFGSLFSSFLLWLGQGWPATYYTAGAINLIMAAIWLLYASSKPSESRHISSEELEYIERMQQVSKQAEHQMQDSTTTTTINEQNKLLKEEGSKLNQAESTNQEINSHFELEKVSPPTKHSDGGAPWLNILCTRSVWAFIICKISVRWCADVLSIELPTYLASVLHLSINLNGIINSLMSALFAISTFLTGYTVSDIVKKQARRPASLRMSKTNLRKTIQSIASFGSALTMFLMTRYTCNIIFSMAMLLLLACFLVMGTAGELQIPYDMTSKYPGTLHGMACTLSVSGWLAPPIIGLILADEPSSRYRWSIVWYMTASLSFIGGLVFLLFADASPRDFDSFEQAGSTADLHNDGPRIGQQHQQQQQTNKGDRSKLTPRNGLQQFNDAGSDIAAADSDETTTTTKDAAQGANESGSAMYFDQNRVRVSQQEASFIGHDNASRLDSAATKNVIYPFRVNSGKQSEAAAANGHQIVSVSLSPLELAAPANKPPTRELAAPRMQLEGADFMAGVIERAASQLAPSAANKAPSSTTKRAGGYASRQANGVGRVQNEPTAAAVATTTTTTGQACHSPAKTLATLKWPKFLAKTRSKKFCLSSSEAGRVSDEPR